MSERDEELSLADLDGTVRHAHNITVIAQAFEHYLTTGAAHGEPVNPNRSDDDA